MEVTSLIDHTKTGPKNRITTEWGLSLHVKYNDFSILFDMGSSGRFIDNAESVRALGQALLQSGVEKFYTSHCTGSKGYRILKDVMGESLEYFSAGSSVRI